MTDRDIQILAHSLLKLHGDNALKRAGACIDDAICCGDDYGFGVWARVFGVIDAWQRQEGSQTRH